jgi:hypothetical protein
VQRSNVSMFRSQAAQNMKAHTNTSKPRTTHFVWRLGGGLEIPLRRKVTQKMMTPKQINDKLRLWCEPLELGLWLTRVHTPLFSPARFRITTIPPARTPLLSSYALNLQMSKESEMARRFWETMRSLPFPSQANGSDPNYWGSLYYSWRPIGLESKYLNCVKEPNRDTWSRQGLHLPASDRKET